jgi:hypothetical protein
LEHFEPSPMPMKNEHNNWKSHGSLWDLSNQFIFARVHDNRAKGKVAATNKAGTRNEQVKSTASQEQAR